MSVKTPAWLETPFGVKKFDSSKALADAIGATTNRIAASFSMAKKKPGLPATWKGYKFWHHDPRPPFVKSYEDYPMGAGIPLLVGNPKHHIGVWR